MGKEDSSGDRRGFRTCGDERSEWACRNGYQRRKPLEFEVGEHVFLRVTPTTGFGRAIKNKKLNPRYVGPFEILRRFRPVAYQVALPPHLSNLHDVFHVSQLRKYMSDAAHVWEPESVKLKENLTFQVTPVRIDDTSVKKL
nr:uncharacterized protein LOC112785454 [Arachis hypogaea]